MGGDLPPRAGEKPTFVVSALLDAGTPSRPGTPLDRVQIVKGWIDGEGETHEFVYDVACSGGAAVDAETHRCPDNGARVDISTCAVAGDGSAQLRTAWRDPDFDARQPAFYYARVIENPTCRWSQKLCIANHIHCGNLEAVPDGFEPCCGEDHVRTIQERAWTSPIWYTPNL